MLEEVNENGFGKLMKKKVVVVDFWASWCMPCLIMSPIFEEVAEKLKGIEFAKVNVDENQNLAEKFKVMSIPTLIVFKDGKEVERVIGARQAEQLESMLRKYANK